jgi:hypothetical protein
MGFRTFVPACAVLAVALLGFAGAANAATFTCSAPDCPIAIVDNPNFPTITDSSASPYPSNLAVSGLTGTITKVTVTLTGFVHSYPDDVDVLLVGPTGTAVELMSDAGAGGDVLGATLTFDDAAPGLLPDGAGVTDGTYKPSNYAHAVPADIQNLCVLEAPPSTGNTDPFPAPAPAPPTGGYSQTLSTFNGTAPNGTWKLFVAEDCNVDGGSLDSWSLDIEASGPTAVTVTGFDAAPRGSVVDVQWRSAAEVGVLGYNVYRTHAGYTARLNRSLIAVRGSGSVYRFLDRTARPGTSAYRLQIVSQDGSRRWFGRAVAPIRR